MRTTTNLFLSAFILAASAFPALGQLQHAAQVDDGANHFSFIVGSNPGGTFVLPSGGGTLLVQSAPNVSTAWLTAGNSAPSPNILGTVSATDVDVRANNTTQLTVRSAGGLNLPATLAGGVGILFQSGAPLLHTFGTSNTFLGANAGNLTMTGGNNTAVGTHSYNANTSGSNNAAFGAFTLQSNQSGGSNTAVGSGALSNNTLGGGNTAVGTSAMSGTTTSNQSTAVGNNALFSNAGDNNVGVGSFSGANISGGTSNTAVGYSSMGANVSGNSNTSVGSSSMNTATGSNNTAVGAAAGLGLTSGGNNTFIGVIAGTSLGTISNATAIGSGATVAASNTIQLGNGSVTLVTTNGGLSAGGAKFTVDVNGNATTINNVSYSWPAAQASAAGQVLTNDGAGNLSWGGGVGANLGSTIAATWMENNVPQNSTNVVMAIDHVANHNQVLQAYAGKILAVTVFSDVTLTVGSITVEVTKNGVGTGLTTTITAGGGGGTDTYNSATGSVSFSANDRIGMRYTTSAAVTPNNSANITCTAVVKY